MGNFIFSLNATVPIFLVMVFGWILMKKELFTKDFAAIADKYEIGRGSCRERV